MYDVAVSSVCLDTLESSAIIRMWMVHLLRQVTRSISFLRLPLLLDVLRLTMFPARGEKAHKRHDVLLKADQPLQVVSEKFHGKNVILIPCESDYFLSTETEESLIDWVVTLKCALAQAQEGKLLRTVHLAISFVSICLI